MAKLGINTGSAPDAGDGDNLQQGAIKINSNFDEVYTLLGNGTALAPGIVTSIVGGNNIAVSTSVGQVTLNVTGNTWDDNTTGIHTLSNVGIGTTNATDELKVSGTVKTDQIVVVGVSTFLNDVNFNYDLTIGEDASLERNLKVTGVSTFVGESNFNDSVLITGITTCNSLIDANGDLDVDGHTELDNLRVSGVATFASNVYTGQITATSLSLSSGGISASGNNANLNWGTGNFYFNGGGDPEIGWVSGNGIIRSLGAGSTIFIKGGNPGENMGVFRANGASELYYNNAKKIETTNAGVTVTGALNATSFVGDGSGLTGINATGTGVSISDGGSFIGVASAINFGSNLSVSSISAGIVTVTGQAGGASTANVVTDSLVVSGVSTFTGFATFESHLSLGNNDQIRLGSGDLMKMYYSSAGDVGAFVESHNNDLHLVGSTNGGVRIITYNQDSLVANRLGSVDLYHNGAKKFETTGAGVTVTGTAFSNQLNVSGVSTFTGDADFGGDITIGKGGPKIKISDDFEIYSTNLDVYLRSLNEDIYIANNNNTLAKFGFNYDSVELYQNGTKRLETTSTGVTITGAVNATSFVGDGSGLSGVNATGTGVSAFNSGAFVGVASAFNFADNLTLSPVSAGLVTVTAGAASTANVVTDSLVVSGISTFTGLIDCNASISLADGGIISLGTDNDLQIRHNGSHSQIRDVGTGNLLITGSSIVLTDSAANETLASFTENASADLYYDGSKKFETTGYGVTVTGGLSVSGISTINGNIIVGHNPSVQGTGSILKAHELNLTGPNSSDSNSSYYSNIRANKVGSGFKYDLEFHSNGYSSGDIGDFIFYKRGTSSQRTERMRLSGETGKLTVTGDGSFGGSLISPYTGNTKTYTVTTASKTSAHRYNGTGSGTGYLIDGVESPFLTLTPGKTYRFTNDNTGSHPLKFYLEADKTTEYTTGVTFNNAYTEITVSDTTPQVLHYQCTNHAYMGNAVYTNTNKVQTPYSASVGAGTSVNGVDSPALTLSHNNPILTGTAGTTGQIKQIGGAPFYYDGSSWREFVLSSGTPVTVPADTDWDNVIYRNTFDSNFVDAKFNVNGTVGSGTTIAGSPVKVGSGSFRIPGTVGAGVSYPNRSEYNFTGSWTIEGWFFLDSLTYSRDNVIVAMAPHSGGSSDDWVFGYYSTSNSNVVFVFNNEHNSSGATILKTILNAEVTSDWIGKWRHIALVREGSDGSLHFYVDGVENSFTATSTITDNNIVNNNQHSLFIGGIPGSAGPITNGVTYNNSYTGDYSLDDLRITAGVGTAGQRYTSVGSTTAQVFTPSTVALPTTGTLSSNINPPGDKYGEIVLGGSPSWVGTSGITVSQQSSGNYRLTFATPHTNSNDYFVLTQAMDQGFASYVGVARSTSHVDFSVNRESNDAAVDTGSLSVQIKNHS